MTLLLFVTHTHTYTGTDACVTPVYEVGEFGTDAHTKARRGVRTVHTGKGPVPFPAPAPKLSHTPAVENTAEHRDAGIGDHTTDILRELGMDDAQIEELLASGAVVQASPQGRTC